jgi:hypothetical protein
MAAFRYGHATASDWREAARSCLAQIGKGPGNLGFLYATDLLADRFDEIVEVFRNTTGVPHWVGTVGVGVCASGQEYLDEPALAAMVGDFEPGTFNVFSGIRRPADVEQLTLKCGGAASNFATARSKAGSWWAVSPARAARTSRWPTT